MGIETEMMKMEITDKVLGIALEAYDQQHGYSKIEKMRAALNAVSSSFIDEKKYVPCGGCGAKTPKDRCVGCHHPFIQ